MRKPFVRFVSMAQLILVAGHFFVYETWLALRNSPGRSETIGLGLAVAILSATFVSASLLARKYSNPLVRAFYRVAAVWLGLIAYLFIAACVSWLAFGLALLLGFGGVHQIVLLAFFGLALAAGSYGVLNAMFIRVRHVTVKLPHLPASWRGRIAAFVSDLHLGHVHGRHFATRLARMLSGLGADIVLVGGDMYDGTKADVRSLAEPFRQIASPLGTYFVAGNHEEFSDRRKYLDAVGNSGVRVLNNEKVVVDGLQIVGIHYHETSDSDRFRAVLRSLNLDPNAASILLTHAPHYPSVAAEEKIGLQLSGHTHGGQFFPFTWITSRIWGPFVYGLKRLGNLLIYTSCGVGTWGPPMRLGTSPEVVLIGFE